VAAAVYFFGVAPARSVAARACEARKPIKEPATTASETTTITPIRSFLDTQLPLLDGFLGLIAREVYGRRAG